MVTVISFKVRSMITLARCSSASYGHELDGVLDCIDGSAVTLTSSPTSREAASPPT